MSAAAPKASSWAVWLPLALFFGFVGLVALGLYRPASRDVRSAMVGKPMPGFALVAAVPNHPGLALGDLRGGKPRLVNVFASWCVPCAVEAPQLARLKASGVEIDGIAIRDHPADVTAFLARNGDPFTRIGSDPVSAVQVAMGSSGVPETFVVDGHGVIRHQTIGDIRPEDVPVLLRTLAEAGQ